MVRPEKGTLCPCPARAHNKRSKNTRQPAPFQVPKIRIEDFDQTEGAITKAKLPKARGELPNRPSQGSEQAVPRRESVSPYKELLEEAKIGIVPEKLPRDTFRREQLDMVQNAILTRIV